MTRGRKRPRRAWGSQGQHDRKPAATDEGGGGLLRFASDTEGFVSTEPLFTSLPPADLRNAQLQITARAKDAEEAQWVLAELGLIPDPYPPVEQRPHWGQA